MNIAIVGWGSLIRDTRDLSIAGPWLTGGPVLPIEFSRISKDGRLTLVIDEKCGVEVTTRYARSSRINLDDTIDDLCQREETTHKHIGYVNLKRHTQSAQAQPLHTTACRRIEQWAKTKGFEGVVWTALPSNFAVRQGQPFSTQAAVEYLKTLAEPAKTNALRYFERAPAEVMTPARRKLIEMGVGQSA